MNVLDSASCSRATAAFAALYLLAGIRLLNHRAGEAGQRVQESIEAVNASDLLDEVDLALDVKTPCWDDDRVVGNFPRPRPCASQTQALLRSWQPR